MSDQSSEVSFSALIFGLSSAALYYLGEGPVGEKQGTEVNLPLAEQNINIVQMLKEKTSGNLTKEEHELIDQVLADLQMRYVKLTSRMKS